MSFRFALATLTTILGLVLLVYAFQPASKAPSKLGAIGEIVSASSHKAGGQVEIVRDGAGTRVVFKADFFLDEAPAARLAWGKGGYQRGTNFATLKNFKGVQEYIVPAGVDISSYDEFWIWCEKYDVGLAVARLK